MAKYNLFVFGAFEIGVSTLFGIWCSEIGACP